MRKAIRLKLTLEIQGDAAPADDFGKSTIKAVRDMLSAGHWRHPTLAVTVKDIAEDENYDADDDKKDPAPPAAPAPSTPGKK